MGQAPWESSVNYALKPAKPKWIIEMAYILTVRGKNKANNKYLRGSNLFKLNVRKIVHILPSA